jgi:phage/conjugal plasmid C-4 type zinc finger TraR family protein
MADIIDRANDRAQEILDDTIAALRAKRETGTRFCVDCCDEIPGERRRLVPWARRCLSCQEDYEKWVRITGGDE